MTDRDESRSSIDTPDTPLPVHEPRNARLQQLHEVDLRIVLVAAAISIAALLAAILRREPLFLAITIPAGLVALAGLPRGRTGR